MPAAPLRLLLRALIASQRPLPEPARGAVERATGLRLGPGDTADEKAIDGLRRYLASSTAEVEVVDYGAGTRGARPPTRRVADVYRRASSGPLWGRAMTGLVRGLRPQRVLELGTNLGISAAHIALALRRTEHEHDSEDEAPSVGRLVTLEGAPALADLAHRNLAALGLDASRVQIVVGPFAETLAGAGAEHGPFDLVFIDGHHERDAALAYIEAVRPSLAPHAVIVLDDVEPGRPVREAYRALRTAGVPGLWLGKWGVLAPIPSTEGAAPAMARPTDTQAGSGSPS